MATVFSQKMRRQKFLIHFSTVFWKVTEIIEAFVTSVFFCLSYQTEDFVTGYRGYDELLIEPTDHCQTQNIQSSF